MARLKPAEFDERMTLVEHLDELRSRIVVAALVLVVAVAICFWQDELLLDFANEPLPAGFEPATFSPTEPFFITVKLAVYGGLLLSLPLLLYQMYAFVLPAFSPQERRLVLPFLLSVPFLFIGGAAFAYLVVMPAALDFLLGFNAEEFNTQLRGSDYYGFFALTLISVGILFQIPVGVLAICRLGITSPERLARNRRYAVLVIAIAAMLLPGTDPVTMLLAMGPLYALFELSLLLARAFGRPPAEEVAEPSTTPGEGGAPA